MPQGTLSKYGRINAPDDDWKAMPGWLSSTQRWRVSAGLATQWTADTVCELLARPVAAASTAADPTTASAAADSADVGKRKPSSPEKPAGHATDEDAHFSFDAAWWAALGEGLLRRPRVLQWLDAQCVVDPLPAADAFDANEAAARLVDALRDP
jgi:hypothetical protein